MYDIVMIGSSIFEFWQQPKWQDCRIANCAVRSTVSQYWLDMDLSQLPTSKSIVVYCGSNDLIFASTKEQIIGNIKALLNKLTLQFPSAKIGYFSIIKCPQKCTAGQLDIIDYINSQIKKFCLYHISYFEFNDLIDNQPKWFVDDGLHLTAQAYQMLDRKLAPMMTAFVNKTIT